MSATHLYVKTKQNTLHILEVYISNSLKICLKMQLLFRLSVMSYSFWPHDYSMPGFPVYHYLPKLAQTHVHWVGDAIQSSRPLSSPSPPALNLSQHQGIFQWVSSLHQVARVLDLHFIFSPSSEYSGLVSFSIDWVDLLAVQGALKSLLQYHSSKASIFSAQPSLWPNSHIHTWLQEKPQLWLYRSL